MKYSVLMSCGHEQVMDITGKPAQRENSIEYYGKYGICQKCYETQKNKENSIGCQEVEMLYKDYMDNFFPCKTKHGSYNRREKTIVVYVPRENSEKNRVETHAIRVFSDGCYHLYCPHCRNYLGLNYGPHRVPKSWKACPFCTEPITIDV